LGDNRLISDENPVRWRYPRKTLMAMRKKQFWDLGDEGIAQAKRFISRNEWTEDEGWGSSRVVRWYVDLEWWSREDFIAMFMSDVRRRMSV